MNFPEIQNSYPKAWALFSKEILSADNPEPRIVTVGFRYDGRQTTYIAIRMFFERHGLFPNVVYNYAGGHYGYLWDVLDAECQELALGPLVAKPLLEAEGEALTKCFELLESILSNQ